VLEEVARTISSSLRMGDTVGRWGGEEFLAILPDADDETALLLAKRCRTLLRYPVVSVADTAVT
jgi:diguanylate cyclase (GGDEF)-like protein